MTGIEKFSKTIQKNLVYFVIADIAIAVVLGYYFPHLGKSLKPYVYVTIFVMLIPMMTAANLSGIVKAFKSPKIVLSGIILNFIITPPLGYLFARLFYAGQPKLLPIGYILNMVTPCSSMVIAWTALAGGSIEVATMLVAVSLILAIIFIPGWMWVLTHTWVTVPFGIIFKDLATVIAIPIVVGYTLRFLLLKKLGNEKFMAMKPILPAISTLGMFMIVFIAMSSVAGQIIKTPFYIALVAVSMCVYYMALFFITLGWGKIMKIKYEETTALAYSVTAKNLAITIAIASVTWGGLAVLVPAFDPVIQVPVMLLILSLLKRFKNTGLTKR